MKINIPTESPYIAQAVTKENEGDLREALSIIYLNFRRLIREENFKELDAQIGYCSVKWLSLDIGLAVLTATLPHKTPARQTFYKALREKFLNQEPGTWDGL